MRIKSLLMGGACIGVSVLMPALAQAQSNADADQLDRMQRQMQQLQEQMKSLKGEISQAKKKQANDTPAVGTQTIDPQAVQGAYGADLPARMPAKAPSFMQSIKFTPSGFIEMAGIWRTRNEVGDFTDFNTGIPFPISPLYHENEFRFSARQSRIALLAEGNISQWQLIKAYFELDFLGASATANSRESNSYTPRTRHVYLTYDDTANGWHLLAGQAWSLLTQNTVGITPRKENIPLVIDAQYVVGFNWSRNPQIRLVKDFGPMVSIGVSAESPQVVFQSPTSPAPFGMVINNSNNGGTAGSECVGSSDRLLDRYDTGFYRKGSLRSRLGTLRSRRTATLLHGSRPAVQLADFWPARGALTPLSVPPATTPAEGWGIGGSVLLPVWPKFLDLQGSVLYGHGDWPLWIRPARGCDLRAERVAHSPH